MTQGLLDFFVGEAGEDTEQLDGALAPARAIVVGEVIKTGVHPDQDALAELFDLLELATSE